MLTAFDALTHAIEGYCCKGKNALSDRYSILAINNIINYLPSVLSEDKNLDINLAYLKLLEAATYAGVSFSNSMVGSVHAIAHAVGSYLKVGHDFAVANLLPFVLKFNLDKSYKEYALLYDIFVDKKIKLGVMDKAVKFIEFICEFYRQNAMKIGGILTLKDCGMKKEDFDIIANIALSDGAILTNPKCMSYNNIVDILTMVWENNL